MIGSAEKAGSGVNKIMSGWEYAHWRSPYLTINHQPDRLELELPMFSIIPDETLRELKSLFGDTVDLLGKDELTILATCAIEGEVSNTRLQYMIDLHRTDITKLLQEMCKQGYLLSDNKGRWTTYHLNSGYLDVEIEESDFSDLINNVDTSPKNVDTSPKNVDTSPKNVDTSPKNVDTSPSSEKRPYVKKEDMEAMILNVCSSEFKQLDEIAKMIDRDSKYIKNTLIPNLIKSGKLERLYPKIKNHPHQAFKTKE